MKIKIITISFFYILLVSSIKSQEIGWQELDSGLFYTEIEAPLKSEFGDSKITILKIDPSKYDFKLICAKETGEPNKTAEEWAKSRNLFAVINAGMYQMDHKTNVGYMKNYDFFSNRSLNNYNTILAFNRKDTSVPEIQIIDLKCQDWEELKDKYNSYSQGIRMIDCNQRNRWVQQNKKWSTVAIGMDKHGNALFLFTRSPYSVHDFINILLELPIDIYNTMYLEGGPEASFYLNHDGIEVRKLGSFETGFNENDKNKEFWRIPNVIGILKKHE